jgi:hypothetical protein
MRFRILFTFAAIFAIAAVPLHAQTLYKLVDKKGKVTYSDAPPKDFDGQVIPIEVDQKRNSATLTTPGMPAAEQALKEKSRVQDASADRLRGAQQKLETARKNLALARENPLEGEVERRGNAGGGSRPVFTEAYERRIAALEQAVRDAESEVRLAERAR